MRCPFFLVDAFVAGPFTGNPAAVCLLEEEPDAEWMALVAAEVRQAETAYCWPDRDLFGLRWFTPSIEVDLCGHATLATAHVLYETGRTTEKEVSFKTRSGVLTCSQEEGSIAMDFPSEPPSECPAPDGLAAVVPSGWRWCGRNRMDWFVELDSPADLRGLRPDFDAIRALGLRGIVVTALGDQGSDFVSRFFAPQSGIPEDHATGSAHCALAPYWVSRLGRNVLTGFQLSPRGAVVHVEDRDGRTTLKGAAVTALRGEWLL